MLSIFKFLHETVEFHFVSLLFVGQLCDSRKSKKENSKDSATPRKSRSPTSSSSSTTTSQRVNQLAQPQQVDAFTDSSDGDYEKVNSRANVGDIGGASEVGGACGGASERAGAVANGGEGASGGAVINGGEDCDKNGVDDKEDHWKPLLLIIPLRLGLTEINPVYTTSLKVCHSTSRDYSFPTVTHVFLLLAWFYSSSKSVIKIKQVGGLNLTIDYAILKTDHPVFIFPDNKRVTC